MNTIDKKLIKKIFHEENINNRKELIKIYCDESCHLQYDKSNILVLGALFCHEKNLKKIKNEFYSIKTKYHLTSNHEIKFTNVSKSKIKLYCELMNLIFKYDLKYVAYGLYHFNKEILPKQQFDALYYNLYENLLDKETNPKFCYKIYIDRKDTRGFNKLKTLNDHLCESKADINHNIILSINEVESHTNPLIQLSDLLTGLMGLYMKLKYEKYDINLVSENKQVLLLSLLNSLSKVEKKEKISLQVMDMSK